MSPRRDSKPRLTDRLVVGRNVTLTSTLGNRFPGQRPQNGPNRKHHLLIVVTMQQSQDGPKTDPKEKALLCRCPATGAVIQLFQKCKWSWNEQNHIGECGDDSFTVRTHRTHIEAHGHWSASELYRPSDQTAKKMQRPQD
jgi:hypothetical protein